MNLKAFPGRIPVESFLPTRLLIPVLMAVILITTATSMDLSDLRQGALWAAIHLVALAIAGVPAVAAKIILVSRGQETVSLAFIVGAGVVVGLSKAVLTAAAEGAFGLSETWTENLALRGAGASAAGVWVVVFTSYADSALHRLRQAREELVQRNVATRLLTDKTSFRIALDEPVRRLEQLSGEFGQAQHTPTAGQIREVVDESIRPLSKALWSVEDSRYPRISARSFLESSLQSGSVRAAWVAGLWTLTSFTALAIAAGWLNSAAHNITIGLLAYGAWSVLPRFLPRNFPMALLALGAASSVIVALGSLLADLTFPALSLTLDPVNLLAGSVWMMLCVLGISGLSGALEIRQTIHRDLASHATQRLLSEESDSLVADEAARQVAIKLHGEVQSRLLAIASALDLNKMSTEEASAELDRVMEVVSRLHRGAAGHAGPQGLEPTEQQLSSLVAAWKGLMAVRIDTRSQNTLLRAMDDIPELMEIIREALTNANRHGRAKSVTISVETNLEGVMLTVSDNGYGPKQGAPGLGSRLLDHASGSRWSLTPGDDVGSVLRVELIARHEAAPVQ